MGLIHDSSSSFDRGHSCRPPSKHGKYNKYYFSDLRHNSVWMCDECGQYFVSRGDKGIEIWYPVAWYHFKAQSIINKEKKKEVL